MLPSRAALLACCLLLRTPQAYAEAALEPGEPEVAVRGCPDQFSSELGGLLRLELGTLMQERRNVTHAPLRRVIVECRGERVRIEVELESGRRSTRWVSAAEIEPDARARTLALTATELADSLFMEREVPQPARHAQPSKPARRRPRRLRPSVHLGGGVRRVGSPAVWLAGAVVAAEIPVTRALAPMVDLRFDAGRKHTDVAVVDVLSCSVGSYLLVGSHAGPWRWGAGPGMRVGWVSLQGVPAAGSGLAGQQLDGPWGGPAILGRLAHAPGGGQLLLTLSVDAGLITLPVVGTLDAERSVFAMDGGWAGVSLLVGLGP